MPASKIQDKAEVIRWFEEGKTYHEMSEIYREKYNIETVPSLWANFRLRNGLPRRIVRDDDLLPWAVKPEHRGMNPAAMLRAVARQRAGAELTKLDERRVKMWLRTRKEEDSVVHYDPDTEEGFWYVPRRPGVDKDLIREPERKTGRGNQDKARD